MDFPFLLFQLFAILFWVGGLGFLGYLALRFVRAREREAELKGGTARQTDEIARLADTVSALQAEVGELREHQQFLERLLEKPRT